MKDKRFTMVDESFICDFCGKNVAKLNYTARDHCPYCLMSKHVDINPGDRMEDCHGMLKPIAVENHKKGYKIIYRCERCRQIRKNIMATDDNIDLVIDIMVSANKY